MVPLDDDRVARRPSTRRRSPSRQARRWSIYDGDMVVGGGWIDRIGDKAEGTKVRDAGRAFCLFAFHLQKSAVCTAARPGAAGVRRGNARRRWRPCSLSLLR